MVVVSNSGPSRVELAYPSTGIPVRFSLELEGQVHALDFRPSVTPWNRSGTVLPQVDYLEPSQCLAFYVNVSQLVTRRSGGGLISVSRLLTREDATFLVECAFQCPEIQECQLRVPIRRRKVQLNQEFIWNVRRTVKFDAYDIHPPTIVPMDEQKQLYRQFDTDCEPIFGWR